MMIALIENKDGMIDSIKLLNLGYFTTKTVQGQNSSDPKYRKKGVYGANAEKDSPTG